MLEKFDYRLGLDLGTNSIGWCIYKLDSNNGPIELKDMGVRIFPDGYDPNTKKPLAVERRTARGQRRLIHRRKLRRKQTFRLLQSEGLFPKTKEECESLKSLNPYELRIAALDRKLEPYELGRVLFNLSVRRGFKSNRKDAERKENDEKKSNTKTLSQSDKCSELEKAIIDSGYRTLGEFLWNTRNEHSGTRFVEGRMTYYPTRKMYEDEFAKIKDKQIQFYPNIKWDEIYTSIFDQRKLESQERGCCIYMTDKERSYKALPSSEKIRILQEVRNLKYNSPEGKTLPISEDQEKIIINILYTKAKASFDSLKKAIGVSIDGTFNLETTARSELGGSPVSVKMRNAKNFGKLWDTLSLEEQDTIVEKLITADEDSEVLELLKKYDLSDEQKQNILHLVLPSGTTMLCKEVTQQIVKKMESLPMDLHSAVESLGYKYADQEVQKFDTLPYYGKVLVGSTMGIQPESSELEKKYGKISNPTVHVALNQTRTVVNAIIKEYGKPKQIVVELSRDLKASREAKKEREKKISENQKRNVIINKNLTDAYKIEYPNREHRLKFKLWEELSTDELSRKCIYCGKVISGADLFSGNIEIEHILPFSRTLLNSASNKTLAHNSCNAFKKDRSPFEAFGSNPPGYNWNEILQRANMLKDKTKVKAFSEDAMEKFENKESGFIARQLTDNAYLSRSATKYLKSVCDDVWTVNGGMTKLLRDEWRIDSILKRKIGTAEIAHFGLKDEQIGTYKKNRYDHRHHALDASVIALVDRSLVKQISDKNKIGMKNRIEVPQMPVLREELIDRVKHIVPSIKPDHGIQGKLSKETYLGKIKQEITVSYNEITEENMHLIKSDKVRTDFEESFAKTMNINTTRNEFKDIYPTIKIYKEKFVARTSITSINEKNIGNIVIVDRKIQKELNEFIATNKGRKFEELINEFSAQTGIKKVRIENRVQTPIEIKGTVPRYLAPEDYYKAMIWAIPTGKNGEVKYQAVFIRRDEVDEEGKLKVENKPHPAAKFICEVFKDDYLEISKDNQIHLAQVKGYSATQNKLDIRPVCAVDDCFNWILSTNERMLEGYWKPQRKDNFVSVNVIFGELQAHLVTVNPIGRVFRKK